MQGAIVGLDGIVDAAGAQVDRRHHLPPAPILRIGGEMPLDAGHGGGEIELLRAGLEARCKGLGRQLRRAVGAVDGERQKRNGRQGDGGCGAAPAQGRFAEHVARAARRPRPEKPARRFGARRLRFVLGEQPTTDIALDLRQLLAVELRFRIAAGLHGRPARQGP